NRIRVAAVAERCIEVDDVEHGKAVLDPPGRDTRGVRQGDPLGIRLAADELDHASGAQVDGRYRDHCRAPARKFAISCRPPSALFSGWNCTPTALPALTAAGNRSPV